MRELFIDCSTGLAGDMLAAALLGLFPDEKEMTARLNAMGVPGIEYSLETVERCGVIGRHLRVSYLGREEDGDDDHGHDHGRHHHRGLGDIYAIVDALSLSEKVRGEIKEIYAAIAEAEAAVHGREAGEVHFHELGAMDAVADIAAVCFLMDALAPDRISASAIRTGFGSVKCAHGVMPVPAPATALLLRGTESFAGDREGELCTPTGAALAGHFAAGFGTMPQMELAATGCGMGGKDFGMLSCVRTFLGESRETIIELCCNVDDMTPEAVGFAIDELLSHGAADACYLPLGMKKNRPGLLLVCLCREEQRREMVELIFRHTSTIGVRETLCRRYILKRREERVTTPYGDVRVKISQGFGVERKKAEYDDLARIARENDLSLDEIQRLI